MNFKNRGLTLIEVIMVVAIMGTLGILASPLYSRLIMQTSVSQTTEQITSQLRKAQSYAMAGKKGGSWGVKYISGNLILFQGNSYATRNAALDETVTINSNLNITGLNEIVFAAPDGLPTSTTAISIISAEKTSNITVNSQGVLTE